jgi:hypothetical protein
MNQQNAATCLTGKRDGITFELSVKIEGSATKVYNEEEMDGGGSQAWIASEEGKVCGSTPRLDIPFPV